MLTCHHDALQVGLGHVDPPGPELTEAGDPINTADRHLIFVFFGLRSG